MQEHAPKVKKWKGLSEYRINFSSTPDRRFDGVAEVWFKNKNDMDVVFGSKSGQVARKSATEGSSEIVVLLTEEHVLI